MRTRWLVIVAAAVAAIFPGVSSALDAPHDASFSNGQCAGCHTLFSTTATGGSDYSGGCISCHNTKAPASGGFLWMDDAEAVPGEKGTSHSWSKHSTAPQYGAKTPSAYSLTSKLVDSRLQCVTCHDPHHSADVTPASMHTSIAVGTPVDETGGPATSSQMTLVSPGTAPKGYRLKIQADGSSFVISHDFGLATPTWLNYVTGSWVAGTAAGPGRPFVVNTAIGLDDPAVTVRWSAGAVSGAYWDFYVGFPFLRMTNVEDTQCVACHLERVMDHVRASGEDPRYPPDGQRRFSHPVGVGLTASYDRAAPLDTNGAAQTTGDGVPSNDLVLDAGSVRCTTCHAVHNADSNSLTDDVR